MPWATPIEDLIDKDKYQVFLIRCPATLPFSFAAHTHLAVNRRGSFARYTISYHKARSDGKPLFAGSGHICKGCNQYLHRDDKSPAVGGVEVFPYVAHPLWTVRVADSLEGGEDSLAKRICDFLESSFAAYPYADRYSVFGPNSNTYTAWILNQFPDSGIKLPWNAFGKGHVSRLSSAASLRSYREKKSPR